MSQTLAKYKEDLLHTLESLKTQTPTLSDDLAMINYLIAWSKVRIICLNGLSFIKLHPDKQSEVEIFASLLKKFNDAPKKHLTAYILELKRRNIRVKIEFFTAQMQGYFQEAQQYLKEIPKFAMEIYEKAWFFVNLYRFALDENFTQNIRKMLQQKMQALQNVFEIEAGQQSMEADQHTLDQQLSNSLKLPSPSVPTSVPQENVEMPDDAKTIILASDVSLPEEVSEITQVAPIEVPAMTSEPLSISLPSTPQIAPIFPYRKWFPRADWNSMWHYRYCSVCGKILHPETRVCLGCGRQFPLFFKN